ncbi:MAG TPA: hypothetical protein VGH74_14095 [Planctomycetaceae bacterium]
MQTAFAQKFICGTALPSVDVLLFCCLMKAGMRMQEAQLIDKLRKVEALFAGAASEGERDAAAYAIEKIRDRLHRLEAVDPPVEYRFTMQSAWSRKLFVALMRRYGIQPYRYAGQRHTTVMAKVSKGFVDQILWPEFRELDTELQRYLDEVTERVIAAGVFADQSEAEERPDNKNLPAPPS